MNGKKESILHKLVFPIILALLVGGSSPWWWDKITAESCPNIEGVWYSTGNNITQRIEQKNCNISWVSTYKNYTHHINGKYKKNQFDYSVDRVQEKPEPCTAIMHGKIYKITENSFESKIVGTDGRCGLKPNFKEHLTWNKQ